MTRHPIVYKLIVSRKHDENIIRTYVKVEDGSPSIEMDLNDFKAIVLAEVSRVAEDFKAAIKPSMITTKSALEQKIDQAFVEVNIKQRIESAFEKAIARMKQDSVQLARHIR